MPRISRGSARTWLRRDGTIHAGWLIGDHILRVTARADSEGAWSGLVLRTLGRGRVRRLGQAQLPNRADHPGNATEHRQIETDGCDPVHVQQSDQCGKDRKYQQDDLGLASGYPRGTDQSGRHGKGHGASQRQHEREDAVAFDTGLADTKDRDPGKESGQGDDQDGHPRNSLGGSEASKIHVPKPMVPRSTSHQNREHGRPARNLLRGAARARVRRHYAPGMKEPSDYELAAWRDIQRFKGRPMSQAVRNAGEHVATGAASLGKRATKALEKSPRARAAVTRGQDVVAKGARAAGSGASKASDALPDGMVDWSGAALVSIRRTVGRVSRAGLSDKRVVARHQKRGHDVESLADLRRLDLEQIDAVRGRGASWYYPAAAAMSGAGAGLAISGGELVIPVSGGVAAAPSGAAIAGAMVGDAAFVLGLASRCVGQVSLLYGYDPEDPGEKLFVMSVVNAGTAVSSTAKTAAMADISRLTQALVRAKPWVALDQSIITQVSRQFAKAFGVRFTKQSLGKVVPVVGIALGSAFNWATLEAIVDAANIAYRRRFLLEKYPHLGADQEAPLFSDVGATEPDDGDVAISVLDELSDAGGPDLS